MLDRDSFFQRCQTTLTTPELVSVAENAVEMVGGSNPRFAYYFNPHSVFTRVLKFPPDQEPQVNRAIQNWAGAASRLFHDSQAPELSHDKHLGGVPAGCSEHEEIYFEVSSDDAEYTLHEQGRSFRVRLTVQADGTDPYIGRLLLIQTRYPVPKDKLLELTPANYWNHIDLERYPAFKEMMTLRSSLASSTALPCVVDCFVVYLDAEALKTFSMEEFASARIGGAFEVARFRKTSTKFDLREWCQDPVSGEMEPNWAYLTFDHVQAGAVDDETHQATVPWERLVQIELEVGPSVEMTRLALHMLIDLDRDLAEFVDQAKPVYGRKIHRLLSANGVTMGR